MKHPVFVLLSRQEWRQLIVLMGMVVVLTAVELAGIGGAGLFIQLAADPESMTRIPYVEDVFEYLGVDDARNQLLATLAALLIFTLLRNVISIVVLWWRLRFLHFTRRNLATRLMRSYLALPYSFYLRHNSAMMAKTILLEANEVVTRYLFAWVTLVTDGLMLVATMGFLFFIEPVVTLVSGAVVGVMSFAVAYGLRNRMRSLGALHRELNEKMFKVTNEALAGIKEVKVLGREESFATDFHKTASRFAQAAVKFAVFNDGPRYLLEIIAVIGFFVFMVISLERTENMAEVAGLVGAFGFAVYRILPVTHRIVAAIGGLNFNRAIVQGMVDAIAKARKKPLLQTVEPLQMNNCVELRNVSYRYEGAETDVLRQISLRIGRNESLGIVGLSGAGKSTLVDTLIGLLQPTDGAIAVDGKEIHGDQITSWQRNVGYVPQVIHLLDDTIRRNIALGLTNEDIDDEGITKAIDSAQLAELIESLPDGLDTLIGERGVRISGGQRQRIGIARALYHQASVLVLDEATSALDTVTEAAVRQSIEALKGKLTVVVIAHRLTTVCNCNRIIVMEAGRIVAEGDYATLERESEHFRALMNANAKS